MFQGPDFVAQALITEQAGEDVLPSRITEKMQLMT